MFRRAEPVKKRKKKKVSSWWDWGEEPPGMFHARQAHIVPFRTPLFAPHLLATP